MIVCVIDLVIYLSVFVLKVVQVGTTVNFAILRLRYVLVRINVRCFTSGYYSVNVSKVVQADATNNFAVLRVGITAY